MSITPELLGLAGEQIFEKFLAPSPNGPSNGISISSNGKKNVMAGIHGILVNVDVATNIATLISFDGDYTLEIANCSSFLMVPGMVAPWTPIAVTGENPAGAYPTDHMIKIQVSIEGSPTHSEWDKNYIDPETFVIKDTIVGDWESHYDGPNPNNYRMVRDSYYHINSLIQGSQFSCSQDMTIYGTPFGTIKAHTDYMCTITGFTAVGLQIHGKFLRSVCNISCGGADFDTTVTLVDSNSLTGGAGAAMCIFQRSVASFKSQIQVGELLTKEITIDRDGTLVAVLDAKSTFVAKHGSPAFTIIPIQEGNLLGLSTSTVDGFPKGTSTWYCSGAIGTTVNVVLERVPNTGGHAHGGSTNDILAVGYVFPTQFVLTGPYPQNYPVVHKLPEFCGSIKISAQIGGTTLDGATNVKIPDLIQIIESDSIKLKIPLPEHPSPYWVTYTFSYKLSQLSSRYFAETGKPITITDASLEWGGRFDLNKLWSGHHFEHRDGNQADVRSNDMTDSNKIVFQQLLQELGFSVKIEGNHWHVRG